jgi:hypothetical protein
MQRKRCGETMGGNLGSGWNAMPDLTLVRLAWPFHGNYRTPT